MLGVFDSGVGGLTAVSVLRKLLKNEDIIFLADRENAPYGTKSAEELTRLVRLDIERLTDFGANKILMACCTASTVYDRLSDKEKAICYPIIEPTAKAAAKASKNGIIAVLATEATVRSEAFKKALLRYEKIHTVNEFSAGELVTLVEKGARDGSLTKDQLTAVERSLGPILDTDDDGVQDDHQQQDD